MSVDQIVHSEGKKIFSITDAQTLLPLIYRITEVSNNKVSDLFNKQKSLKGSNVILAENLDQKISEEVKVWQGKLIRLGVIPKGMWLADFDNGNNYYCWKFPETEIRYFHGYKDGFSGRIEIQ